MKSYLEKHHRALGVMGAVIAFVIGIIYLVIVPKESSGADLVQKIILVYGHSLCWFLLCAASVLWSVKGKNKWSMPLAYTALATYIIFMSTLLFAKSM